MEIEMNHQPLYGVCKTDILALIIAIVSVIYGTTSCRRHTDYDPYHGVAPCAITAPIDSLIEEYFPGVDKGHNPGGIITVMRRDTIVYNRSFGYGRLDTHTLLSDSTTLNLSSISKLFTGVAIARLIEKGLISPDDTISKFFPKFPKKYFGRITVAHMLSHTSGLPDLRPTDQSQWDEYLEKHKSSFGYDRDYRRFGSEQEHMRTFENLDTIAFEPGTHYDRYDMAYVLVAPLIETLTGCKFDDWMDENLFRPAGMTETFYLDPSTPEPLGEAHGYRISEGDAKSSTFRSPDSKWEEYDYDEVDYFNTKADRGAWSSSRDIMRFFRALRNGKIISRESIEKIIQPVHATNQPNVSYGLGIPVERKPYCSPKAYHMNVNGGFGAIDCWWPEGDVCYIILTNRNDWQPRQRELMFAIDRLIRENGWD